ncbi:MAG: hypothetical protein AAGL49_07010 [Pseudomonadota bacterium]
MTTRRHIRTIAALAATGLAAAACATSTPYQPADNYGKGFSEQKIEGNRYRVSFEGNSLTDLETVGNYMLFRSAEVTVQRGFDYFVVADRKLDEKSYTRYYYNGFGHPFGFYHTGFGRYGHRGFYGAGAYGDGYARERTSYTAIADIVMFSGEKPPEDSAAYDARDVMNNLRPVIQRPAS